MEKDFNLKRNVIFCLLIFVSVVFMLSGCGSKLIAPRVSLSANYLLSWASVSGAASYEIDINGTTYSTQSESFDISPYIYSGEYSVKVRALPSPMDIFTKGSDYSNEITFSFSSEKMSSVTGFNLETKNNSLIASWDYPLTDVQFNIRVAPTGTTNYKYLTTKNHSCDLQSIVDGGGYVDVAVRVVGYNLKQPSDYSEEKSILFTKLLSAPKFSTTIGNNLSWNSVGNAVSYNVNLLGSNAVYNTTSTSINISTLNGYNPNGINVVYVQSVGSDANHTKTSNFGNGYAKFNFSSQQEASNITASILGTSFDFCVNSQTEMNALLRYTLFYRMESVKFYMPDNSVWYNSVTRKKAISTAFDSYPEIMCVTQSSATDTILVTLNINYYDTTTPLTVAAGDYEVTQESSVTPQNYAPNGKKRANDFSSFKITTNNKGTLVAYTGEQLFQILSAGYMPIFVGENTTAKQLYNQMCNVLREIVCDDMTDFQKVLAIYEWVCYTNKYDHNLSDLSAELESKMDDSLDSLEYSKQLWDLRGFYLEGMFFDDGQAVCDGIAKAFASLCSIEGIECYKVNGQAIQKSGFTTSSGGHAWNKVKISNIVDTWYAVDCTWGDNWSGDYDITEILAYDYFMNTDEIFEDSHLNQYHQENYPNTDVAEFKNYTFTDGGKTYDLYVSSKADLNTEISFLSNSYDCFSIAVLNTIDSFVKDYLKTGQKAYKLYNTLYNGRIYNVYMIYNSI